VKIGVFVPFSWSFSGAVVEHVGLQAEALEAGGHEVRLVIGNDPPGQFARALPPRVDEPVALTGAVAALLADESKRVTMGAAARALALDRYAWRDIVRQLEGIYERVIARVNGCAA